ncbi:MAG: hypothetical protein ACYCPQ_02825 [Elusimicrobiota bacterium]
MKLIVYLALAGLAAWFVMTRIKQIQTVQKASAQYVQNLKSDASTAKSVAKQVNQQTQAMEKTVNQAKAASQ